MEKRKSKDRNTTVMQLHSYNSTASEQRVNILLHVLYIILMMEIVF